MLEQAHFLCPIEKQNSDLRDRPHDHLGGALHGVERLGNVTGVNDCLVSNREPRPYSIKKAALGLVHVHEQIFVADGEAGGHAEPIRAGKFELWELLPVVVVVQDNRRVDLRNNETTSMAA